MKDAKEVLYYMGQMADKCLTSLSAIQKDYNEFIALVKRMREAQMDKDILEMRLRFKIDQDEKISEEDNAEFATAMCNVVFYEDKVDEYLEKMDV